jgi:ATP-binding cassette subfamily F protein 3
VIPPDPKVMKFSFKPIKRSGDNVVSMVGLGKYWEMKDSSRLSVFHGITGVIERTNKIALTGVNGAGKSTLLKVITEQTNATEGSCTLGASVNMGYFSQYSGDILNPNNTIFDEVSSIIPNETIGYVKNLLGSFQFSGDDADKKIGLAQPLNFLVLDEPTNHLDIASREVLLEALQEFKGTVIIVSHDRYFLKHLVNRVFEIDHGQMNVFEGDYEYYMGKKKL